MFKKYLFLSLALTILLSLFACGDGAVEPAEEEERKVAEEEVIPASVIHEMINRGETVKFSDALIEGDIDSRQLNLREESASVSWLPKPYDITVQVIESSISFIDCVFTGYVLFRSVLFQKEVDFQGSLFKATRTDILSDYYGDVAFTEAFFESDASFKDADFRSGASFRISCFKGDTDFSGVTFHNPARFGYSFFEKPVDFNNSTFMNSAYYRSSIFDNRLDMRRVDFRGLVDFQHAELHGATTLYEAEFGGVAYPPEKFTGSALNLRWDQVKDTVPRFSPAAAHCYAGWEAMFLAGGYPGQARKVERTSTRNQLGQWFLLWLVIFLIVTFYFAVRYYIRFHSVLWHSRLHNYRIVLLFSLDVLTPGIGAYKYDWERRLPIKKAVALTSIESIVGWILLGAGATIGVSWLVA